MIVKAGICVAYDWQFLKYSLPPIYSIVDEICLSVDEQCRSWNGNGFEFDWASFQEMIEAVDTQKKIRLLKESFYHPERTPIQNECYQRTRMADFLGPVDWLMQIDTDEILINPEEFIDTLRHYNYINRPVNIHGKNNR